MDETKTKNSSDHDLLITLNVRVQDLIETIRRMESMTTKDIGGLKEGKLDKADFATHVANDAKDHESIAKQIETLNGKSESQSKTLWIGVGVLATLQFIIPFVIKFI